MAKMKKTTQNNRPKRSSSFEEKQQFEENVGKQGHNRNAANEPQTRKAPTKGNAERNAGAGAGRTGKSGGGTGDRTKRRSPERTASGRKPSSKSKGPSRAGRAGTGPA